MKKGRIIAGSVLSIIMCSSLIAGATMALFTSESTTNIAVTSGNVNVVATAAITGGSSLDAVETETSEGKVYIKNTQTELKEKDYYTLTGTDQKYSGYYYASEKSVSENEVTFTNGGTAKLTGNKLTLNKITPGDSVNLKIDVTNYSNVTAYYRIKFYVDNEYTVGDVNKTTDNSYALFDSLAISVPVGYDGTNPITYSKGSGDGVKSYTTAWTQLSPQKDAEGNDVSSTVFTEAEATIELPLTIGNSVKNKTCDIYYMVEAVQGNANLGDNQLDITYIDSNKSGAAKAQTVEKVDGTVQPATVTLANAVANGTAVDNKTSTETANTSVSVTIPSAALTSTSKSVQVNVTSTTLQDVNADIADVYKANKISIASGSTVYAFDIKTTIDGNPAGTLSDTSESTETNDYYVTSFTIASDVVPTVYHIGNELVRYIASDSSIAPTTEYYTYDTNSGVVTVYTKSFSPFVISYLFGGGTGESTKPYLISSVEQLQGLAEEVNGGESYSGKFFELTEDLDLNGINWTPIGHLKYKQDEYGNNVKEKVNGKDTEVVLESRPFMGTFNGNNHTISNFKVSPSYRDYVGLFGYIAGSSSNQHAKVEKLTLENVTASGNRCVGSLVGYMTSFVDVDNVTVKTSTINGGNWVGGIAGGSYGCITNCKVESSKITASPYLVAENEYDNGDKAGGIVGYQCASTTNIKISGCTVDASIITGYRDIGGIAGTLSWSEAEKTAPSCTGNTVKDTSIIQSLTNAYGKDISSLNIGGIYGRIVENTSVKVTLSNNTIKDKDDKVLTSAAISGDYYHNLEDNTYYIGSKAGLYAFAAAVNAGGNSSTTSGVTTYYHYSGKTFNLVADIDLNNEAWTPIGTEDNPFKGTFDGNNHTISNLYINDSTKSYIGLFGVMNDSNAKIQNVKVKNVNLMGEECVGSIIGSSYVGSLYNCHVSGKIILSGNYKVGGITGNGYAPIDTCTVDGGNSSESSITGIYNGDLNNREGDNIGGIIGYFAEHNNHTSINNCSVSNISIQGTRKVGGIAGYLESNDMVTGATVSNVTISTTAKTTKISEDKTYYDDNKEKIFVGGIVGEYQGSKEQTATMISGTVTNSSITGIDNYTGLAAGGTRQSNKFYTSVTESGNTGNYTTTTTNNVIDTVTDVTAEQNGEEEETA